MGTACLMGTVSFWGDENVLNWILEMVTSHCEYTKNHRIAYFKMVERMSFVPCEFYLNCKRGEVKEGVQDVVRAIYKEGLATSGTVTKGLRKDGCL